MDRRAFTAGLAAMLAAPLGAMAQQATKIARIGILSPTRPVTVPGVLRQRLQSLGWAEGVNYVLDERFGDEPRGRLRAHADELVRLNVDVIVAVSGPAITAAKQATATIPIVMSFSGVDPIKAGFVRSFSRPGGNVTGLAILAPALAMKRLEALKEAVGDASQTAVLVNPRNPSTIEQLHAMRAAASALKIELHPIEISRSGEYAAAFAVIAKDRPHAMIVPSDPEFFRDRRMLVDLIAQARLPAAYDWRDFVELGGLLAYSANIEDLIGRVAVFVDKILRGAKPADLPVEQPTKFELVINLKTAKALRLTIPPSLLLRADQVIE